jgi:hypothetical protein
MNSGHISRAFEMSGQYNPGSVLLIFVKSLQQIEIRPGDLFVAIGARPSLRRLAERLGR